MKTRTELYNEMVIRPEWNMRAKRAYLSCRAYRARYEKVGAPFGMPYYVVALLHMMESDFDFTTHLANGDPLTARTTHVPAGIPSTGKPPFTWEESASFILMMKQRPGQEFRTPAQVLEYCERYNGLGYYVRGRQSPYLWSGSAHYEKGKFGADGRFDADLVSRQVGCAPVLKMILEYESMRPEEDCME